MDKYRRLRERVEARAGGLFELRVPPAASDEQLALVHDSSYIARVAAGRLGEREIRALGFPWSPALVERSRRSSGATIAAARAALSDGVAANLAGGTHHAFRDRPQGFCVFNDAAVATMVALHEGLIEHALIVDCDVHQGNGTAAILAHESRVFTFSIHGERNFPFRKERSDLDIGLPDGTGDSDYLDALDAGIEQAFGRSAPELVVYLAGADPFAGDRWGRMGLTKRGLGQRDSLVYDACRRHDAAVVVVMAGGYAPNIDDIVDIHYQSVEQAGSLWRARQSRHRLSVDPRGPA